MDTHYIWIRQKIKNFDNFVLGVSQILDLWSKINGTGFLLFGSKLKIRKNTRFRYIFNMAVIFSSSLSLLTASFACLSKTRPLNVVSEVLQPFQYQNEKGKAIGYSIEVLEAILSQTDYHAKYEFLPWPRAFKKASTQKNTILLTVARTAEREKLFHWIGLVLRENYSFFSLKSSQLTPRKSIEELKKHSIVVIKNSVLDRYLTQLNFPYVERSVDIPQTFRMLYKNRVDLIFKSHTSLRSQAESFGYDYEMLTEIYQVPDYHTDLYIAVSADSDPDVTQSLIEGFKLIETMGINKQLRDKWQLEYILPTNNITQSN